MTGCGHVVLRLDRLVPVVHVAETCYGRAKVEPPGRIGTDHVITDDVELTRVSGVGTEDVTITGDVVARVYRFYITLHGLAPIASDDTGVRVLPCLTGSAHLSPSTKWEFGEPPHTAAVHSQQPPVSRVEGCMSRTGMTNADWWARVVDARTNREPGGPR
jgi:hypothetical protein